MNEEKQLAANAARVYAICKMSISFIDFGVCVCIAMTLAAAKSTYSL